MADGQSSTHGMKGTRVYQSWADMLKRCRGTSSRKDRNYYIGRGIGLEDRRWERFEAFYADMGPMPSGKTLDRIDNDRGYSPANCRWATSRQQHRNKRSNRLFTVGGVTLCMTEWAELVGVERYTFKDWVRSRGIEAALERACS